MRSRHEDGIRRNPVHINTGSSLYVIHVYVAVFGDQVDDVILRGDLHRHGEVVLGFSWEEYIDGFLEEGLVACWGLADLCGGRKKRKCYKHKGETSKPFN